jgi:hypothetical protein
MQEEKAKAIIEFRADQLPLVRNLEEYRDKIKPYVDGKRRLEQPDYNPWLDVESMLSDNKQLVPIGYKEDFWAQYREEYIKYLEYMRDTFQAGTNVWFNNTWKTLTESKELLHMSAVLRMVDSIDGIFFINNMLKEEKAHVFVQSIFRNVGSLYISRFRKACQRNSTFSWK